MRVITKFATMCETDYVGTGETAVSIQGFECVAFSSGNNTGLRQFRLNRSEGTHAHLHINL